MYFTQLYACHSEVIRSWNVIQIRFTFPPPVKMLILKDKEEEERPKLRGRAKLGGG